MINKFGSEDNVCCAQIVRFIPVHTSAYKNALVLTNTYYILVHPIDRDIVLLGVKLSGISGFLEHGLDCAEVEVNCMCSARSCATCWCPDNELVDAHSSKCKYRRMAEVMGALEAARDQLLD
jgi:hypothetical protein